MFVPTLRGLLELVFAIARVLATSRDVVKEVAGGGTPLMRTKKDVGKASSCSGNHLSQEDSPRADKELVGRCCGRMVASSTHKYTFKYTFRLFEYGDDWKAAIDELSECRRADERKFFVIPL